MSVFTDAEVEYLRGQRLARLATLGTDGSPQNQPVGFRYNAELDTIDIGGHNMAASRKYRNVQDDPRVSFVVDDLASVQPWRPRGWRFAGTPRRCPSPTRSSGSIRSASWLGAGHRRLRSTVDLAVPRA